MDPEINNSKTEEGENYYNHKSEITSSKTDFYNNKHLNPSNNTNNINNTTPNRKRMRYSSFYLNDSKPLPKY